MMDNTNPHSCDYSHTRTHARTHLSRSDASQGVQQGSPSEVHRLLLDLRQLDRLFHVIVVAADRQVAPGVDIIFLRGAHPRGARLAGGADLHPGTLQLVARQPVGTGGDEPCEMGLCKNEAPDLQRIHLVVHNALEYEVLGLGELDEGLVRSGCHHEDYRRSAYSQQRVRPHTRR